ncbi:hypothetical protein V5E97_06805 [Singulisphaera sp. Ch08]|uniref:Uncharacterized protein n=1 Tax=Singulisphaera sp. Ch08 TaxID=3120278 RepID=A0AAU7CL37_9BACT
MKEVVLGLSLMLAVGFAAGYFAGKYDGMNKGQREERLAITRHGFGRYVFDEETGNADFEYGLANGWVTYRTK